MYLHLYISIISVDLPSLSSSLHISAYVLCVYLMQLALQISYNSICSTLYIYIRCSSHSFVNVDYSTFCQETYDGSSECYCSVESIEHLYFNLKKAADQQISVSDPVTHGMHIP